MKHVLTLSLLAGISPLAHAQITITAAQYPATAATVERFQQATVASLSTPTLGPNQSWDYRGLVPQGTVNQTTYSVVPAPAPFVGTVRSYNFTSMLGPFTIPVTAYEGFSADGFTQLGSSLAAQSFPLTFATGGANDVLAIPAQNVLVNILQLPLPLTATTRVQRTTRAVINTRLTIAGFGLSNVLFQYVQRTTTVDSVAGWGTLRVPVAGSASGSGALPVLLVRSRETGQDSFYLGGQPAPATLLGALGQTQGSISRSRRQSFYRQNSAQPVLTLVYASNAFAVPTSGSYSAENTLLTARPAAERAQGGLVAWPNPVASGQVLRFTLAEAPQGQPLRLTLRDAVGRAVWHGPAANGHPVSLPMLPAGLYVAEAESAAGFRTSRRVVVE